jgi:AcrR family transcriptional regulator
MDESERIKTLLFEAGERAIERDGAKRLRVEDLAQGAGIAKGSFYRFFPTKEDFVLALLDRTEDRMREGLGPVMEAIAPENRLAALFDLQLRALEARPWLARLMRREEIMYLSRAIGPERMGAHAAKDDVFIEEFLRSNLPADKAGLELAGWTGAVKAAFYIYVYAEEFGPGAGHAARFILDLIARNWKEEIHGKRD